MERGREVLWLATRPIRETYWETRKSMQRSQAVRKRRNLCKHALSAQLLSHASSRPRITERNLDGSRFLALPLEIRRQIYDYYYESDVVKIQDLNYDGTYFLCYQANRGFLKGPPGRGQTGYAKQALLGLPLTCRTIYPETIELLYAKTGFYFTDPELALRVPETIPMPQLRTVTSLKFRFSLHVLVKNLGKFSVRAVNSKHNILNFMRIPTERLEAWPRIWSTIATLPNLKKTSLNVERHPFNWDLEVQPWMSQYILEPFRQFGRGEAPEMVVQVCWFPGEQQVESLKEAGLEMSAKGTTSTTTRYTFRNQYSR